MKSRNNEVNSDQALNRFASYFMPDVETMSQLEKAYKEENTDNMRTIISSNSAYDFIGDLMEVYDSVVQKLAEVLLTRHGNKDTVVNKRPKARDIKRIARGVRSIRQQREAGIKKKRWTTLEENYILRNKDKPLEELIKNYNQLFDERTKSSIVTKRSRIKSGIKKQG